MTIQAHIERLRAKPEHIRRRIALWSSLGITALIFVFWIASLSVTGTQARGAVASIAMKAAAPSQSLSAAVGNLFRDIRDVVWSPKKVEYSTIEVAPGK